MCNSCCGRGLFAFDETTLLILILALLIFCNHPGGPENDASFANGGSNNCGCGCGCS